MIDNKQALFSVGDVVHHKLFDYRGVIVDVDPSFQESEEWYEQAALSCPPKDKPWYHLLVDNSENVTYVSEKNIELDDEDEPVEHPLVEEYFSDYSDGSYTPRYCVN